MWELRFLKSQPGFVPLFSLAWVNHGRVIVVCYRWHLFALCFTLQWECCGAFGADDWNLNIYFNCTDSNPSREKCGVPFSCCTKDPAVWLPENSPRMNLSNSHSLLPFMVKHKPLGLMWNFCLKTLQVKFSGTHSCLALRVWLVGREILTDNLVICGLQKAGWSCQLSWLASNRTSRPQGLTYSQSVLVY